VVSAGSARYLFVVRAVLRALALRALALRAWAIVAVAIAASIPGIAHADPIVVVEIRGPRQAEVVLRDADRIVGRCRTENGTCEIHGVRPGRYTVSARTDDGQETPGRPVLLPPDGRVSLIVAVP